MSIRKGISDMAFYTETLREYVQRGNEFPESFRLLNQTGYDFETLFYEHYADREIGFETEELFALKLKKISDLYIPEYVKIIENYDSVIEALKAKSKKTESLTENGKITTRQFDLPIAGQTDGINPSGIGETEPTNTKTTTTNDESADELTRKIDWLMGQENNAVEQLLEKFERCFMQVF